MRAGLPQDASDRGVQEAAREIARFRREWDVRERSLLDRVLSRIGTASAPLTALSHVKEFVLFLEEDELLAASGVEVKAAGNIRLSQPGVAYWTALETIYPLFDNGMFSHAVIKRNLEVWGAWVGGKYEDTGLRVLSSDVDLLMTAMGYGRSGVIGGRIVDSERGLTITYSPNGHKGDPQPSILVKRRKSVA